MNIFETADKAQRLADNAHEIAEIQKILSDYNQGRKIDRQKALEIINRLNGKDAAIAAFNSRLNPGWVSFSEATDEQIVGNLDITSSFLSGKMTAQGIRDIARGVGNNNT
mgnify:CR=1 FL=1